MKGLILCAGRGTRLLPFTEYFPKCMLPVANKPILYYLLEKFINAGITEICVVVNPLHDQTIKYLGQHEHKAKIEVVYQDQPLGIAHALKQVRPFIEDEPFVVLLGDNLILEPIETLVNVHRAQQDTRATLLLFEVEKPEEYGVAEINQNMVVDLEEKPTQPKSNLAIAGMYLFDPLIFKAIESIGPSWCGEYEITDAIQWIISNKGPVSYAVTNLAYVDVGRPERWLQANRQMLTTISGDNIEIGRNCCIEDSVLTGPVIIGDNTVLSDVNIGPYVSIGEHSQIKSCQLSDVICLAGADLYSIRVNNHIVGPQHLIKNKT